MNSLHRYSIASSLGSLLVNRPAINGTRMKHSARTEAGITRAKSAGTQWGQHGTILAKANKAEAQKFSESLFPLILDLMLNAESAKQRGPSAMAEELNILGVPTARGGIWHPATVHRLVARLEPGLSQSFKIADDVRRERTLKKDYPEFVDGGKA